VNVAVIYVAPGVERSAELALPNGSSLRDAIAACGIPLPESAAFAIFGQRAQLDTPLRDGDRVEILRPLIADARSARRQRAASHPLPATRKAKRPR
jgi:hypothetical protein